MSNAIVLMSGGVDSFACAHLLKAQKITSTGLFVNYGQAALRRERAAFKMITTGLRVKPIEITLRLGKTFGAGEIAGRNGLFVMAAISSAPRNTTIIAMGIHAGTPYYDCSLAFVERMDEFVREYSEGCMRFIAPFASWSKSQIFDYCKTANLNISIAYSCERGGIPCGTCNSCRDRTANDARQA